jgi:hypothetical protein
VERTARWSTCWPKRLSDQLVDDEAEGEDDAPFAAFDYCFALSTSSGPIQSWLNDKCKSDEAGQSDEG